MYVELVAAGLAATQMPVSEIGVAFGFPGQRGPFSALAESDGPESEVAPQTGWRPHPCWGRSTIRRFVFGLLKGQPMKKRLLMFLGICCIPAVPGFAADVPVRQAGADAGTPPLTRYQRVILEIE